MAKIKWRGGAMLSPVPPTMVTCSCGGKDNVFTVAWTGITNTIPPKTYISVRPSRHSHGMIRESGEFAIHLTTAELVRAADFCGVHTGAKIDKFERCHLEKEAASELSCPILAASPLVLECRVTDMISLGSHDMFLADIVAIDVDESLVDAAGKLHLERAGLVAYAHGDYFELGRRIGTFGYSVAKKKKSGKKK
ncbi:MAG: flavin reductase family protein [Ruminococcaceae bacterium]|nr:flavin reductase family protein [Oscillospiraceae bacterium]